MNFNTFSDIKNSCIFRPYISAVWSNLNCNLKKLYSQGTSWMKHLLPFFLSKSICQKSNETSTTEKYFSPTESPGTHTLKGKYPLGQWPCTWTCTAVASPGTLLEVGWHQFPTTCSETPGLGPKPLATAVLAHGCVLVASCFPASRQDWMWSGTRAHNQSKPQDRETVGSFLAYCIDNTFFWSIYYVLPIYYNYPYN